MLRVMTNLVVMVMLFSSVVYGFEDTPSTSPDFRVTKFKVNKAKAKVNPNIITFSEFPSGTHISNQYADKGIIFDGNNPFITGDGSNPTSPVLSGTPQFNGAIEGKFVDPITHDPTVVNHFELDAGYFNNLSSTRLRWFNSKGDLIREVLDSEYGIQHFSIDDENIASFRIEIISQEDAGYAIDNVFFEIKPSLFNHKFNLDKITHTSGSDVANTFTIYFKDLEVNSESTLEAICDDYTFFVEDSVTPKFKPLSCSKEVTKKAFKLDFELAQSPYNLENATVSICKKDECKKIEDIKDFSVYGTDFDVNKDGFSFYNGEWNKYMFIQGEKISLVPCFFGIIKCTETQTLYMGEMRKLVEAFKEFLPARKKSTAEKDLIGFYDNLENYKKQGYDGRSFGGVCHGLAVSAVANFNNYDEASSWGTGLNSSKTKDEIVSIFRSHWDNNKSETVKPFKPFSKEVHSYDASNNIADAFHSLGKIGYYYTSQESYSGGDAWVGNSNRQELNDLVGMNSYHQQYLKKNKISIFGFDLKKNGKREGGHTIIATELIKYNNRSIVVLHDNNYVNEYSMLDFDNSSNSFELSSFIVENTGSYTSYGDMHEKKRYASYDAYYSFDTFSDGGLFLYGKPEKLKKQKKASNVRLAKEASSVTKTFDYAYPNHISITIIGGKLLKITDTQTQNEVILNPILGKLEQDKPYLKDDLLITEFLLSKNSIYEIEFQKYQQYPAFEVYVKIPNDNGQVEIINYENLATNRDDTTSATFIVGNGNTDKLIKRDGESDVTPSYDESFDMKITSASFVKAIALNNGVQLTWNLPNNPSLQEVVVIRKVNTQPTAITDGSEVYRGEAETYIDSAAQSNTKYYYGVYAMAKNGDIADGNFIYIDTHQAGIFGYVNDSNANPITNVEVILKNGVGLVKKIINMEQTDKNGYFNFPNLPLGTYLLEFSHPNYTFAKSAITVELANKNMEVSQNAIGIPKLAINANTAMKIGGNETISWDGLNIADGSSVNIKLYQNNTWKTLASNIEYSKHSFDWKVTGPVSENALLKIELVSDLAITFKQSIYIYTLAKGNVNSVKANPVPILSWAGMLLLIMILVGISLLSVKSKSLSLQ